MRVKTGSKVARPHCAVTALGGQLLSHMADGNPDHAAARAVRAARAYSGMSRKQLGELVGVDEVTIGRYERGEWRSGAPRLAILQAIARATELDGFLELVSGLEDPDPAKRFAAVARQEAQQQRERPTSVPEVPAGEGGGGGAS